MVTIKIKKQSGSTILHLIKPQKNLVTGWWGSLVKVECSYITGGFIGNFQSFDVNLAIMWSLQRYSYPLI